MFYLLIHMTRICITSSRSVRSIIQ